MKFNGKKLVDIRRKMNVSQFALAQAAKLNQSLLSKYEKGLVKEPPASAIQAIAEYLEISTKALMGDGTSDHSAESQTNSNRVDVYVHVKIDWGFN